MVHYHDAVLRCFIAMRFAIFIAMRFAMFIAMRLLMHYLGAFCDALPQCIIAGRYHDAAVQFFSAISSLVTFVMHYCGAFCDVS